VLTRAGTPAPIINKLHSEIATILKQKDVRERFDAQGLDVISSTPQEFRAFIRSEIAKHAKIVKDAGVKID
jgi:tripartite-type tricarboxylate transporter receptor subunit TctC